MRNPFSEISRTAPFVLPRDRVALDEYDQRYREKPEYRINRERMPEPRQGPINARLFVLQLNPSFQEGSNPSDTELQDLRERLIDEHSAHVCLERPNLWWDKTFRWLINDVGREVLSKNVCSVELFAYPSSRYAHRRPNVPSSSYQLDVVREAIRREALFVVTRGWHHWRADVPELETQMRLNKVFLTKNRQRAFVSPGNLDDGVYEKIRSALKDGNR